MRDVFCRECLREISNDSHIKNGYCSQCQELSLIKGYGKYDMGRDDLIPMFTFINRYGIII